MVRAREQCRVVMCSFGSRPALAGIEVVRSWNRSESKSSGVDFDRLQSTPIPVDSDSGRLCLQTTSDNSDAGRLQLTTIKTLDDSGDDIDRLQSTLDVSDSRRLRITPTLDSSNFRQLRLRKTPTITPDDFE